MMPILINGIKYSLVYGDHVKLIDGRSGIINFVGRKDQCAGEWVAIVSRMPQPGLASSAFVRRHDIAEISVDPDMSNVVDKVVNNDKIEYDPKKYPDITYNPAWIPILRRHRKLLYQQTSIEDRSLLERLNGELGMDIYHNEYKVLSSKFAIKTYPKFNYFSIHTTNENVDKDYWNDMECQIFDENDQKQIMTFRYGVGTLSKVRGNMYKNTFSVNVRNPKLFGIQG